MFDYNLKVEVNYKTLIYRLAKFTLHRPMNILFIIVFTQGRRKEKREKNNLLWLRVYVGVVLHVTIA